MGQLLERTFALDVETCPSCQGRMKLVALVQEPKAVARFLRHLGEPAEPPPLAPARAFQHDAAHDGPSPLEWAAASETEARVERALLEIPLPFREILLLVVVEGLDHDKVARVLGLTGEAVRQRLARARAKLGERLGERFLPARSTLTEDPDAA